MQCLCIYLHSPCMQFHLLQWFFQFLWYRHVDMLLLFLLLLLLFYMCYLYERLECITWTSPSFISFLLLVLLFIIVVVFVVNISLLLSYSIVLFSSFLLLLYFLLMFCGSWSTYVYWENTDNCINHMATTHIAHGSLSHTHTRAESVSVQSRCSCWCSLHSFQIENNTQSGIPQAVYIHA